MNGENQQAYDRGTTIFSPEGRLYQVDYAREAIKQGAPVVGVRGEDGVALAAASPLRSPLVEAESVEKLHAVDGQVGVATAGHAADGRRLVDIARRTAQGERLRYGEPATVEALAATVADHVQEHTQTGGARPYGTALLVAGYDDAPRLFETDPSGAFDEWRADAVGRGADAIVDYLEDHHEAGLSTEGALALALDALDEGVDDLDPGTVDAATVDAEGYRRAGDEDVVATFGA
jgi:proteasome alpha subunit